MVISTPSIASQMRARPARSLVLKHAPPYIKILGPDYPLSTERLTFESRAP